MSTTHTHDPFQLFKLLADLHEANAATLMALTAIIEHQDNRIAHIEHLLTPPQRSN